MMGLRMKGRTGSQSRPRRPPSLSRHHKDHRLASSGAPTARARRLSRDRRAKAPHQCPSRKGTPTPRSAFRVKPGAQSQRRPRVLTRPRRPVNTKPLPKIRPPYFLHPPRCRSRRGGRGLVSQADGAFAGIGDVETTVSSAPCMHSRSTGEAAPAGDGRPGRLQTPVRRRNKPRPSLPPAGLRPARSVKRNLRAQDQREA